MAIKAYVVKIIESIENGKAPFLYFILTFFYFITLRCFLEIYSDHSIFNAETFIHYYLSFICISLFITLVFSLITREKTLKIFKLILVFFGVILLGPILDLIISQGRGFDMAYMIPGVHDGMLERFIKFFGTLDKMGITIGIRIEIAFILIASGYYFYYKTNQLLRSVMGVLILYTGIFIYLAMPFTALPFFAAMNVDPEAFFKTPEIQKYLIDIFLILIFVFSSVLFAKINWNYFKAIVSDARFLRLGHYLLMIVAGVVTGLCALRENIELYAGSYRFEVSHITNFTLLFLAVFCAWLFSVMNNNESDVEIDKICNSQRPLPQKAIPYGVYRSISYVFLLSALAFSWAVSFRAAFIILLFILNYFIYSSPPVHFKRVPFFSKLVPALNSVILMLAGYILVIDHIRHFPIEVALFVLVGMTAAMNFIDIKDYEGDKQAGIKTLPVLLGLRRSQYVIGGMMAAAYFLLYFILELPAYLLLFFLITAGLQFFFTVKQDYSEKPIFIVHYLYILVVLEALINF